MSVVKSSSAITLLCDCPYSGITREVKASTESELERKNMLNKELRKTNEEINVVRCTLIETRRKVAALRKLLRMELGCEINPYINQDSWRDRVQEESYLKSELVNLVDYLRDCDPELYRTELAVNPTELSTSTEDLLLVAQEKTLEKLYHGYTVYHTDNEKQAAASLRDFFRLKKNYENKLYHNKILEREIASVKNTISGLQSQFLEDKYLIDYIANHHFTMKGCFVEVFPEKNESNQRKQEDVPLDPETMKLKNLWEKSKLDKKKMFSSVQKLEKDLNLAKERILRAENVCADNLISLQQLARKIKESISLSKLQPRKESSFGKFSLIQYRSQKSQLETAIGENRFLRKFLRKAILSRTADLKYYQQSLQSTADKYEKVLTDIRNSLMMTPETNSSAKPTTVTKSAK